MTLAFTSVAPENLHKVKSHVWSLLKKSVTPHGDTAEQLWKSLEDSKSSLVIGLENNEVKGIVITGELSNSKERLLNIGALAGEGLHNCTDNIHLIEEWAYENAFDAIVIQKARPGWLRLLADKGYKLEYVYLRKDL